MSNTEKKKGRNRADLRCENARSSEVHSTRTSAHVRPCSAQRYSYLYLQVSTYATTLLFAGLGTLLFHLISGGSVPAFLGSSFAFIAGYFAIAPNQEPELLPYACFGVACASVIYFIIAGLFRAFGISRVMRFFPPIVTGPIIIAIGLNLSSSAINNCATHWWIALVAIVIVVAANIWGKGMIKIIPIILGVLGSYIVAAVTGNVDFTSVKEAAWIGLPIHWNNTVFSIFSDTDVSLLITSIITIVPISLATIIEHIGDMSAISSTVGRNYIANPGLHRTLLGDGLATLLASLFGAPANTTYGENTGVSRSQRCLTQELSDLLHASLSCSHSRLSSPRSSAACLQLQ